jgi:hypothetical protein
MKERKGKVMKREEQKIRQKRGVKQGMGVRSDTFIKYKL